MFNGKVNERYRQILCDMRFHYESQGYIKGSCRLCKANVLISCGSCTSCPWYQEIPVYCACEVWAVRYGYHNIAEAVEDTEGLTMRLEMISRWLSTPA